MSSSNTRHFGLALRFLMTYVIGFVVGLVIISPAYADRLAPSWSLQLYQWDVQEVVLHSRHMYTNSFSQVAARAIFSSGTRTISVDGFFDGDGTWKIRFMPDQPGTWSFKTISKDTELNGVNGKFSVDPPVKGDHGPVHVANTYHFDYADGTPYFLLGTTSYNWLNRNAALQEQTLANLGKSGFTKFRFGLFPKWYKFNRVDPDAFPYLQVDAAHFDYDRFDPRFFKNVEGRIRDLRALGIQADVILFHPYDHWGFAQMDQAHNEAYLRYVVARLAAYSNVWWTMANEYDLMSSRNWDRLTALVRDNDPYHHPIGIHNYSTWYDHSKPWIDHVILQDGSPDGAARSTSIARRRYGKPVVVDEYGYEGNNGEVWGELSGPEEVARHWSITMAGAYASHGETYVHPGGVLWWAAGGELVGESPERLAFLKSVMTSLPFQQMVPSPALVVNGSALAKPGQAYLFRFEWDEKHFSSSPKSQVRLAGANIFKVELIDPWRMKTYALGYTAAGDQAFILPMRPAILKVTAATHGDSAPVPIDSLLAAFAGEKSTSPSVDASLFKDEALYYGVDFQIAMLQQNPAANAVLEKYLPGLLPRKAGLTVMRLSDLPMFVKSVREEQLQAMQSELEKIPVE